MCRRGARAIAQRGGAARRRRDSRQPHFWWQILRLHWRVGYYRTIRCVILNTLVISLTYISLHSRFPPRGGTWVELCSNLSKRFWRKNPMPLLSIKNLTHNVQPRPHYSYATHGSSCAPSVYFVLAESVIDCRALCSCASDQPLHASDPANWSTTTPGPPGSPPKPAI